ncbi:hypothetical protein [Candidatus Fervidibacter sacchari]
MTPSQLQAQGIKALVRELGVTGMVRFLQQFELGAGDYTRERHKWLKGKSIEKIVAEIRKLKHPSRKR